MFIRVTSQVDKKTGRSYKTHRLVEAYRNQDGKARQRTLLNLGAHFDIPKEHWKLVADRVEDICNGQEPLFHDDEALEKEAQRIAKIVIKRRSEVVSTEPSSTDAETDVQTVDVNSLTHQSVRRVGCEHVCYHAVKQLHLDTLLSGAGFNKKQMNVALGNIIGRLVQPGSELSTHRYLTEHSALDELLGVDFSNLPLKNLYKVSDQLMKKKSMIEAALYQREKDLFNLKEVVTLYDITNTYFEGRCLANPKAQYGRSKEKRNDCPLIALGMVLDASGFPKKSHFFPGNVSEPKTVAQMLETLGADHQSTIVMDAGLATEENIAWLTSSGYEYIVVSRKRNKVMPDQEAAVIVKEDRNNVVQAMLVENESTNELELYCHSSAKANKTRHMVDKATARYEEELKKIKNGLNKKGGTKKYDKVIEKMGRLKEKYKRVARFYEVSVKGDENNTYALDITWTKKEGVDGRDQAGTYCLRTNRRDLDEQEFWNIYTMLTDLEAGL